MSDTPTERITAEYMKYHRAIELLLDRQEPIRDEYARGGIDPRTAALFEWMSDVGEMFGDVMDAYRNAIVTASMHMGAPAQISDQKGIAQLPKGTILLDKDGDAWHRRRDNAGTRVTVDQWACTGTDDMHDARTVSSYAPLTVLHVPTGE